MVVERSEDPPSGDLAPDSTADSRFFDGSYPILQVHREALPPKEMRSSQPLRNWAGLETAWLASIRRGVTHLVRSNVPPIDFSVHPADGALARLTDERIAPDEFEFR